MKAILKETGFEQWEAQFDGISYNISRSYLWNAKGEWDWYFSVDEKGVTFGVYDYFKAGCRKMSIEIATKLIKQAINNTKAGKPVMGGWKRRYN